VTGARLARVLLAVASLAPACSTAPGAASSVGKLLVPNPHFANPSGEYGFSASNPILVGSLGGKTPVANEHLYLGRLRGPDGQSVHYERIGSCCEFPSPNGLLRDSGLLDHYLVTYDGLAYPLSLYLDMYDPGEARAPLGFTLAE
jgi:hypothetical protein